MDSTDSARAQLELLKAGVELVPHWFQTPHGPYSSHLEAGASKLHFSSLISFDQADYRLKALIEDELQREVARLQGTVPLQSQLEAFKQSVTLRWLEAEELGVSWRSLISYADTLKYRTYENEAVVFNARLVAPDSPGGFGTGLAIATGGSGQKLLDPLAAGRHAYVELDKESLFLRGFKETNEARGFEDVGGDGGEPLGFPEFAAPIAAGLKADEYSLHRTRKGDVLIIKGRTGIIATWRKGAWSLYNQRKLRTTLAEVLQLEIECSLDDGIANYTKFAGDAILLKRRFAIEELDRRVFDRVALTRAAGHLLDLIYDLSYRRHGALLLLELSGQEIPLEDRNARFASMGDVIAGTDESGELATRQMLKDALGLVSLGECEWSSSRKRIAEAASIDGAVILDLGGIRAIGAIVSGTGEGTFSRRRVGPGARQRAAFCARAEGALPIKISSDGDITILFRNRRPEADIEEYSELHFS